MKRKTILVIAVVAALFSLVAFKLNTNKMALDAVTNRPPQNNPAIAVNVIAVDKQPVSSQLIKTGTLLPFKQADIMSTSQGKVLNLNIELGTPVTEGQIVATIDDRLKQLALEKAQLSLAKLKTDYERYSALLAGNATTETTVTDLKYNYEDTKNQVEQLQKQLADASVTAPISGIITKKAIEKGEYVNNGTQIGSVVDISKLKVQVMLSEGEVSQVQINQWVKVSTAVDTNMRAQVTYISPNGDDSHNYLIELTMTNRIQNPVKAGGIAYVDFSHGSNESVLQIPRSTLIESIKNPSVYVAVNGHAMHRNIKVGREFGGNIELLEGLKAGEEIITSGQINLSDSASIVIVNAHN
jgi:RND family efflux transporter MFP subunit